MGTRRALFAAVALVAIFSLLGVGSLFTPQGPDRDTTVAAAATPSWRLETGSVGGDVPGAAVRSSPQASVTPPSPFAADEIVTPELIRTASHSPCPATPPAVVSIRDFGARGDGLADDTRPIQKAIDNVTTRGGGRVHFPPGVYRAIGVQQDSCVELHSSGGATLVHPDGKSPSSVVEGRVRSTTGTLAKNSRVLRVGSTTGMRPGSLVAVQAAGGPSQVQRTTLQTDLAPYVDQIQVVTTKGLQAGWQNFLFVGNEIVSYRGISGRTLLNVRRGLFGTEQTVHRAGTGVAQALRLYAVVLRVSPKRVTLDRKARFPVDGAHVNAGSIGMSVVGLAVDGNRRARGSAATNPFPLDYRLARWVAVRSSTLRNGDHGGVSFDMGTRDSLIEGNTFSENGDPVHNLGAAVWLFRGATHNVVRGNTISGRTFVGVMVDDRTEDSTEFDADSRANTIEANTIDIPAFGHSAWNAGVVISGSSNTRVLDNVVSNAETGIMIGQIAQGPRASPTYGNRVHANTFVGNNVGIRVTGSDNEFVRNVIRRAAHPTADAGRRNRFIDNTVEP